MKKILATCLVCLPTSTPLVQVSDIYNRHSFISIGDWFKKAVDDSGNWLKKAGEDVSSWLDKAVDNSDRWIEKAVNDAGKWFENVGKDTLNVINKVFGKINGLRGKILNGIYPGKGINAVEPTGLTSAKLWLNEAIVQVITRKNHLELSAIMSVYITILPTKMAIFNAMFLASSLIELWHKISAKNHGYGVIVEIYSYVNIPFKVTSQSKP